MMKSFSFVKPYIIGFFILTAVGMTALASGQDSTKKVMQSAYQSLSYLITTVMDEEFTNTDQVDFVAALDNLRSVSTIIAEHTKSDDYAFDLVTRSLEENIDQLVSNYKSGFDNIGEIYLVETIDHCAACHSQSPDIKGSNEMEEFVSTIQNESLDTSLKTRILVAVRKFDQALDLWEQQFFNKDYSLSVTGGEEAVLEYVSQAVQFDVDGGRLLKSLEVLEQKESTPYYMMKKMSTWRDQLELLDVFDMDNMNLNTLNKLNADCRAVAGVTVRENFPVCNMLLSTLSGMMLRENRGESAETDANLYLNMGVARMNIGLPSGFVPQIERYLESAILAAPGSDASKTAYAYLEELAYFLYGDMELADEVMNISLDGLKNIAEIN